MHSYIVTTASGEMADEADDLQGLFYTIISTSNYQEWQYLLDRIYYCLFYLM